MHLSYTKDRFHWSLWKTPALNLQSKCNDLVEIGASGKQEVELES